MKKKTIFSLLLASSMVLSPTLTLAVGGPDSVTVQPVETVRPVKSLERADLSNDRDLKASMARPELEKLVPALRDRVRQLIQMFELRINWLKGIAARLESRMAKLAERGVDVSDQRVKLAKLKAELDGLEKRLPELTRELAETLTTDQPGQNFRKIMKPKVQKFSQEIMEAHKWAVDIINDLKSAISLREGAEDTNN